MIYVGLPVLVDLLRHTVFLYLSIERTLPSIVAGDIWSFLLLRWFRTDSPLSWREPDGLSPKNNNG